MVLRNEDEQYELVRLIGARMEQVKESIPQMSDADEARNYAMGTASTLSYLAKKLLPNETFGEVDRFLDSEMSNINGYIDRMKSVEGVF